LSAGLRKDNGGEREEDRRQQRGDFTGVIHVLPNTALISRQAAKPQSLTPTGSPDFGRNRRAAFNSRGAYANAPCVICDALKTFRFSLQLCVGTFLKTRVARDPRPR
jgi:hypothetical protein